LWLSFQYIERLLFVVLALVGVALPIAVGGAILQPAAAQDFSLEEILDFAFDLADVDLNVIGDGDGGADSVGGGGDGNQDEGNVQQQDSTQDRTQGDSNVNQNTQREVQRQSVTDGGDDTGGGGGGNPGCGGDPGDPGC
jgi:hypothetical protein